MDRDGLLIEKSAEKIVHYQGLFTQNAFSKTPALECGKNARSQVFKSWTDLNFLKFSF